MSSHHQHDHQHHKPPKRGLHRHWRLWAVVVLMLAGMAIYVASFDESIVPRGDKANPPATTTPKDK